jgi:hypothetical protein
MAGAVRVGTLADGLGIYTAATATPADGPGPGAVTMSVRDDTDRDTTDRAPPTETTPTQDTSDQRHHRPRRHRPETPPTRDTTDRDICQRTMTPPTATNRLPIVGYVLDITDTSLPCCGGGGETAGLAASQAQSC